MRKLWLASIGAILLLCLWGGVASAQSDEPRAPFCGSLPESECASLDLSSTTMAGLTSGTSINQVKLYVTGAALGDQEVSVVLTSDRSFIIDPHTLSRLNTLSAMPPDQFAADPNAMAEAARIPFDIDVSQVITLAISPELVTRLTDATHINFPNTISFHTRTVNGVIYIRLADFTIFTQQPDWLPEWLGIQTRVIVSNTVRSSIADSTIDPAAIQQALVPPGEALAGSIIYHVPADQMALYQDFMRLVALGVSQQDGELVQVYDLTWDLPRYFGGPLFAERTGQPDFPNAQSRLYGSLATILLDGVTANMRQAVGASNSYVYLVDTNATWAIGLPGGQLISDRPTIGVVYSMHNSNLNQLQSIAAPAEALVPPINFVLAIVNLLRN